MDSAPPGLTDFKKPGLNRVKYTHEIWLGKYQILHIRIVAKCSKLLKMVYMYTELLDSLTTISFIVYSVHSENAEFRFLQPPCGTCFRSSFDKSCKQGTANNFVFPWRNQIFKDFVPSFVDISSILSLLCC